MLDKSVSLTRVAHCKDKSISCYNEGKKQFFNSKLSAHVLRGLRLGCLPSTAPSYSIFTSLQLSVSVSSPSTPSSAPCLKLLLALVSPTSSLRTWYHVRPCCPFPSCGISSLQLVISTDKLWHRSGLHGHLVASLLYHTLYIFSPPPFFLQHISAHASHFVFAVPTLCSSSWWCSCLFSSLLLCT